MSISVNFNEADSNLLESAASYNQISASEFVHEAAMKAARNAEYLAKIDRANEQIKSGKYKVVSWEELEALANEENIS